MDEYDDRTESSDGFAIFIVRHTQIFKAMHEYDKTESSDGFVIVMLKLTHSYVQSIQRIWRQDWIEWCFCYPSSFIHTHMLKAMDEYGDKTEMNDGFVIFMLKHAHMFKAFNEYDDKIR